MNIREAAQQALDEWHTDPGSVRMASLMMKLKDALEQPEKCGRRKVCERMADGYCARCHEGMY